MIHWLPLIGFLVFFAVGLLWRSWLQRRRFGSSGFMLFRSGRWRQHLREGAFVLLTIVLGGEAIAYALAPDRWAMQRLLPENGVLSGLGMILMLGGTALMVVAQLQLGASWRVGIEEAARPGLVREGIYRLCRNPIFLAMLMAMVGFTVLLPTWLTVAVLVGIWFGIRRQVLEEEAYLRRAYGDDYASYAERVGRFLPGIGRLSRA